MLRFSYFCKQYCQFVVLLKCIIPRSATHLLVPGTSSVVVILADVQTIPYGAIPQREYIKAHFYHNKTQPKLPIKKETTVVSN